jgi:nicotinate-nucleotide adenylyltransferase
VETQPDAEVIYRIGLFGGTFNPVHLGHLQAARVVRDRLALSAVLFIPAAIPPHKTPEGLVPVTDRLEMLRLALTGDPSFRVSEVELKRTGPSYTIDTVRRFQADSAADTRYYLILGLDAFLEIDSWKSYQALIRETALVVLDRPDGPRGTAEESRRAMLDFLRSKISVDYAFSGQRGCFECADWPPLHLLSGELLALSATRVRDRIRAGGDLHGLVPAPVAAYIRRKGLYR